MILIISIDLSIFSGVNVWRKGDGFYRNTNNTIIDKRNGIPKLINCPPLPIGRATNTIVFSVGGVGGANSVRSRTRSFVFKFSFCFII